MRLVIRCLAAGEMTGPLERDSLSVLAMENYMGLQIRACLETLVDLQILGTLNEFREP